MARRNGHAFRFAAALLAVLAGTGARAESALPTVHSLNLCTDQLAMLLAAPGQLQSVSELATDPSLSALHDGARAFPANRGLAEEVVAASPDLVVTGAWSARKATDLLKGLGYRVETFAPDLTLEGIRADIARMGWLMRREKKARDLLAAFDSELARAPDAACPASFRPSLLVYGPNGVTEGAGEIKLVNSPATSTSVEVREAEVTVASLYVGALTAGDTELALSPSEVLTRDSKLTATYRLRQLLMAEGDTAHVFAVASPCNPS